MCMQALASRDSQVPAHGSRHCCQICLALWPLRIHGSDWHATDAPTAGADFRASILVNNAGATSDGLLLRMSEEDLTRSLHVRWRAHVLVGATATLRNVLCVRFLLLCCSSSPHPPLPPPPPLPTAAATTTAADSHTASAGESGGVDDVK